MTMISYLSHTYICYQIFTLYIKVSLFICMKVVTIEGSQYVNSDMIATHYLWNCVIIRFKSRQLCSLLAETYRSSASNGRENWRVLTMLESSRRWCLATCVSSDWSGKASGNGSGRVSGSGCGCCRISGGQQAHGVA